MQVEPTIGSICFGVIVGWMTGRVFSEERTTSVPWLVSIIAAIAGGAVTRLFESDASLFSGYCVGLAIGFFTRPLGVAFKKLMQKELRDAPPRRERREPGAGGRDQDS